MTLTETLKSVNSQNRTKIPAEVLAVMDEATQQLIDKGLSSQVLKVGDTFPNFSLVNVHNKEMSLDLVSGSKATIISFYRGGWCPYCNIELKALQGALAEFKSKGASLVAITPETPDSSLTTSEKNELEFEVLSDINNDLAKQIGLVFQLPPALQSIYDKFGIDVAKHNKNESFELPMPATFVLNKNNEIVYSFVNEDYTKRADIEAILAAL